MRVFGIVCLVCCPVIITARMSVQNITSARAKFTKVDLKPSDSYRTAVLDGRQHLRQCMHECVYTADCLVTVFDSGLGRCAMYGSGAMELSLNEGETAVKKDSPIMIKGAGEFLEYSADLGGFAKLYTSRKTWDDAEAECQSMHAYCHLVAITDERKQLALSKMADSAGVIDYFTCGKATTAGSSTFTWSSTGEGLTYTNWQPGEPNYATENCLGVWGGQWIDSRCDSTRAFICELK